MVRVDVDSISPVAQDYVKAIWSATEWGDPPVTTKALAERFGTSAANVTETVRRLATQGLVEYEQYRPVRLTERGAQLAVLMVRRHRLIETFLVRTLGYSWDEIHEEAERLEHAATDLLIDRIEAPLGRPTADPHGDPIPAADGSTRTVHGATRLTAARPGRHVVHRISDADPGNLDAAQALGMTPGAVIETRRDGEGLSIAAPDGQHPIPEALAAATWTTEAPR